MSITLLPALDVADGAVARADGGPTPVDLATTWCDDGAEWIHLVDLDAAFGRGSNTTALAAVVEAAGVRIQLSGGIRDATSLRRALTLHPTRVVIAADALADLDWCAHAAATHGDRIVIALDVDTSTSASTRSTDAEPQIAPRGGSSVRGGLWATLDALDRAGCARYLVTDVDRDGRLNGPNLDLLRSVARRTPARLVASGGVSSADDIADLTHVAVEHPTLDAAVVGTALLDGGLSLAAALAAARGG